MTTRKKYDARCARCLMREELCLCPLIPSLRLATKLVVVITKREIMIPTNTGRLAALALPNSVVLVRGDLDKPYELKDHLQEGRQALLLYPADDAQVLTPELVAKYGGKVDLVVPDGNWRQTTKMRRRDPGMADLPTITLPPGKPTAYRVRQETKNEGLATIEAIARALGVIEGVQVQLALESLLDEMVRRTLSSRGQNILSSF